jgi:hypothetical protein
VGGEGKAITARNQSNIFFDTEHDGCRHRMAWALACWTIDADGDRNVTLLNITQRYEVNFTG